MNRAQDWLKTFLSDKERVNALKSKPIVRTSKGNPRRAMSISITSGKGGVGKTSIALKIAIELGNLNYKVLLIDCDYNLSNTLVKLGLPINENFYNLVVSKKNFNECIYKRGNFHLLPGCNGSLNLFDERFALDELIIDIIDEHSCNYDFILLDCPAGISEDILNINAYCQQRFFILTPDKSSLTDSYSLIKILKLKYGINRNHLIVNRVVSAKQFRRVARSISETAENFLGCETINLGGINEYENKLESFDDILFHNTNSIIHKNIIKVLKIYTEEHGKSDGSHVRQDLPY